MTENYLDHDGDSVQNVKSDNEIAPLPSAPDQERNSSIQNAQTMPALFSLPQKLPEQPTLRAVLLNRLKTLNATPSFLKDRVAQVSDQRVPSTQPTDSTASLVSSPGIAESPLSMPTHRVTPSMTPKIDTHTTPENHTSDPAQPFLMPSSPPSSVDFNHSSPGHYPSGSPPSSPPLLDLNKNGRGDENDVVSVFRIVESRSGLDNCCSETLASVKNSAYTSSNIQERSLSTAEPLLSKTSPSRSPIEPTELSAQLTDGNDPTSTSSESLLVSNPLGEHVLPTPLPTSPSVSTCLAAADSLGAYSDVLQENASVPEDLVQSLISGELSEVQQNYNYRPDLDADTDMSHATPISDGVRPDLSTLVSGDASPDSVLQASKPGLDQHTEPKIQPSIPELTLTTSPSMDEQDITMSVEPESPACTPPFYGSSPRSSPLPPSSMPSSPLAVALTVASPILPPLDTSLELLKAPLVVQHAPSLNVLPASSTVSPVLPASPTVLPAPFDVSSASSAITPFALTSDTHDSIPSTSLPVFAATKEQADAEFIKGDPSFSSPPSSPLIVLSSPGPMILQDEPPAAHFESGYSKRRRSLDDDNSEGHTQGHGDIDHTPRKRLRNEDIYSSPPRPMPAPRRVTLASQRLSHRKLATPFRSPLMTRPVIAQGNQIGANSVASASSPKDIAPVKTEEAPPVPSMASSKPNIAKTLTKMALASRAAGQFRSPITGHASNSGHGSILPTQTIQALERRLTVLRRAVKIKRDDDENKLDVLSRKWREAAREAAYELWSIVRETAQIGGTKGDGAWASGWGWGDDEKVKVEDELEHASGSGAADHGPTEGTEGEVEETIGLMLRRLGIAPETLGWDDAQENFVDD